MHGMQISHNLPCLYICGSTRRYFLILDTSISIARGEQERASHSMHELIAITGILQLSARISNQDSVLKFICVSTINIWL